ncbi:Oidioi.mRNA.OKI2018_I69.chr2.g6435.t1.cds [Oikopleura dioica]|uniref:Oidioi.mRNA.OKI2018_I69.chr2.g6435.t1.cds n=1 Tax=Oikopleura dioica TaxID=34765 RepID=A0ABN7T7T8_OIKDI|nr:Oidioi.mRNA.OKI2018_I69.chr2.g6435.t1.cds [Oikopleura dioica]
MYLPSSIRNRRYAEWAIELTRSNSAEKMEEQGQGGVFLRGLGLSTIAFDSGSQSITEIQMPTEDLLIIVVTVALFSGGVIYFCLNLAKIFPK